ncbi:hypothetical protein GCM10027048_35090 [Hymenobacter coalescens]
MRYCFFLRCLLFVLLVAGTACSSSSDEAAAGQPNYLTAIPDPETLGEAYVSDPDQVLSPATVADLNATLRSLDQAGRAHIDVAVARSIGEAVPKTAAYELFRRWQVGDAARDNGLLILLVLDQRRIEFETGYGLEADLPDALCYRIQQRYMVPAARAGQYDAAVRQGVAAVIRQLTTGGLDSLRTADDSLATPDTGFLEPAAAPDVSQELAASAPSDDSLLLLFGTMLVGMAALVLYSSLWHFTTREQPHRNALGFAVLLPFGLILLGFFAPEVVSGWLLFAVAYLLPLLYLLYYFRRVGRTFAAEYAEQTRHAQYAFLAQAHHGLGFSRYVFPLLAGHWARHRRQLLQLREAPYACPHCARPMRRLSEQEDDAFLRSGQQVEETVQSVDYDVWRCEPCQHTLVLDYQNPGTDARPCPACQHRTLLDEGRRVVQQATRSTEGWGWELARCRHCNHQTQKKYTIARLSDSSSSSSSSGSSSSGSFSSSSGGSSGGGGAGSSW